MNALKKQALEQRAEPARERPRFREPPAPPVLPRPVYRLRSLLRTRAALVVCALVAGAGSVLAAQSLQGEGAAPPKPRATQVAAAEPTQRAKTAPPADKPRAPANAAPAAVIQSGEPTARGVTEERFAADLLIAGRYQEALARYRGLAAAHPDRPEFSAAADILLRKVKESTP
jgi:hypothetical protein